MGSMKLVGGTRDGKTWAEFPDDVTSVNIPVSGANAHETWTPDHGTGLATFVGRTDYDKPAE